MGSRLLPLFLALGALLADATGLHRAAFYLVLLAVVGAAAAAFVGVGDYLEGTGGVVRAATTGLALALLVLGSAVRASAAVGGARAGGSVSTVVAAVLALRRFRCSAGSSRRSRRAARRGPRARRRVS